MKHLPKLTLVTILIIATYLICADSQSTKKSTTLKVGAKKPPSANKIPRRKTTKTPTAKEKFAAFKKKYNKSYASAEEEAAAEKAFTENSKNDEKHNKKSGQSYQRGTNSYSDKDHSWKVNNRMGAKKTKASRTSNSLASRSLKARMGGSEIPDSANWTDWNSPIKDQVDCGACWVFSALAVLEYLEIVIRENLTVLSDQEILDCNNMDYGCDGGWPTDSFDYVIKNGITSNEAYSYLSYQSDCFGKRFEKVLYINETYEDLLYGDEEMLKSLVYNYGPVVVVIYASDAFTQYAGGVFYEDECPNEMDSYNHAIVVVGYGNDRLNGDFWIIKNSWGLSWGEYGYGRIARNRNNMCGIANYAMIPSSTWISERRPPPTVGSYRK